MAAIVPSFPMAGGTCVRRKMAYDGRITSLVVILGKRVSMKAAKRLALLWASAASKTGHIQINIDGAGGEEEWV